MEQFEEGTMFELYENSNEYYVVLRVIKINEENYFFVTPAISENNDVKINPAGLFLLRFDQMTSDVEFVEDEEIISKAIDLAIQI